MKRAEKGGTGLAHKVSTKNRTSVTVLSMEAWDIGQAIVFPHSLNLEASTGQTLPRAYRLSTSDRRMAGSIVGDELAEDRGLFPFFLLVDAMAMVGAELKSDWKRKQIFKEQGGIGSTQPARGEITV